MIALIATAFSGMAALVGGFNNFILRDLVQRIARLEDLYIGRKTHG